MKIIVGASIVVLLFVGVGEGGILPTKNRGLASISGFCDGSESLDDLRDLTEDAYRKITGRYGSAVVKATDSAGFSDYVGDHKSTETDGWTSMPTIMDYILGIACTAGLKAGIKQQCQCPEQITLRGPGPLKDWSVTAAPETIAGWTFAGLELVVILAAWFWPVLVKTYRRVFKSTSNQEACARCNCGDAASERKKMDPPASDIKKKA